jgi:poly(3-hydroxybutyrate) depolymerase
VRKALCRSSFFAAVALAARSLLASRALPLTQQRRPIAFRLQGLTALWISVSLALAAFLFPFSLASAQTTQDDQLPGTTVLETVFVGGAPRDALVYLPASRPSDSPVPMILFLHGNGGDMIKSIRMYGVREEAERAGIIAVFPNGSPVTLVNGGTGCCGWNDGRPIWGDFQPPDDVSFVSQLLDLLIPKYNVDTNRVFAAGMSNGGFMTHRLACELSDRFAAIAVGSGHAMRLSAQLRTQCLSSSFMELMTLCYRTRGVSTLVAYSFRPRRMSPNSGQHSMDVRRTLN